MLWCFWVEATFLVLASHTGIRYLIPCPWLTPWWEPPSFSFCICEYWGIEMPVRSALWVTLGGRSTVIALGGSCSEVRIRQQIASSSLFSSSLPSELSVLYGQISASSNNRQSNKLNLQNNRDLFVEGVSELVSGGWKGSLCFPGH